MILHQGLIDAATSLALAQETPLAEHDGDGFSFEADLHRVRIRAIDFLMAAFDHAQADDDDE